MKSYPDLYTDAGERVARQMKEGAVPHAAYPRPLLVRDSYLCLNGVWEFAITEDDRTPEWDRRINVPFTPESLLSGINERHSERSMLWYRRTFRLPDGFMRSRLVLHIGACDSITEVYVNDRPVGRHVGGYDAFSFDITEFLTGGEERLTVRVTDPLSSAVLPYGKQKHKRGGMWYTPISGIWQTVWLESLPERAVEALSVRTSGSEVTLSVGGVDRGGVRVFTPNGEICLPFDGGRASFKIDSPRLWSPSDPYLYHYEVTAGEDRVRSYFAFRTVAIEERNGMRRLCLNGKPIFLNGVLDQGYFSDGIYTPADPSCFDEDILAMKRLGYNTLRKHIKVEPQLFYAACDRLGMIVVQDMVSNGKYSFLRDTALPTIGLIRRSDRRLHTDTETRAAFVAGMERTVRALDPHPSVCVWTVFNEGWGQFCADAMYRRLRRLDPTRPIDATSGWFHRNTSDFDSRHIYFKPIRLKPSERPIFLSEFGGYCLRVDGHLFGDGNYGYRQMKDAAELSREMRRLYDEEVLPAVRGGLCGAICTQLSDVEDETNGLLTYDRKVAKLPDGFFYGFDREVDEILSHL